MRKSLTLPDDVESLQRLVREQQSALEIARTELIEVQLLVEKLRFELARLKRQQYGRSSEQPDARIAHSPPGGCSRWPERRRRSPRSARKA